MKARHTAYEITIRWKGCSCGLENCPFLGEIEKSKRDGLRNESPIQSSHSASSLCRAMVFFVSIRDGIFRAVSRSSNYSQSRTKN